MVSKKEEKMNPSRWTKLFTLIMLVGVMVAVVAATNQKTPDLTLTSPGVIEPPRFGNDSPLFAPQIADVKGGLSVAVNRSVSVEADEAYVVITSTTIYDSSGSPQPISSENRAAVIAKLAEVGIAKEDIEFKSQPYSASIVSVQVQISDLP
jgi:hypothetical protein